MEASGLEVYLSRTMMLLNELNTGVPVNSRDSGWNGYLKGAYNQATREAADRATAELCGRLQSTEVSKQSPEMQIWWRDHLAADAEKEARAKEAARIQEIAKKVTAATTPEERRALGLSF